jgi:hypothetical protein
MPDILPGLTVLDVARRYRVGCDKVRTWIHAGELLAINTAGRPRWVVTADGLAEFERRRLGGRAPKARRRRRQTTFVDYFPDTAAAAGT